MLIYRKELLFLATLLARCDSAPDVTVPDHQQTRSHERRDTQGEILAETTMTADGGVSLTKAATDAIHQLITSSGRSPDPFIRVLVKHDASTGFVYDLEFDNKIDASKDREFMSNGIKVVVDSRSLLFLEGTVIDYESGSGGTGFRFNNPNALEDTSQ